MFALQESACDSLPLSERRGSQDNKAQIITRKNWVQMEKLLKPGSTGSHIHPALGRHQVKAWKTQSALTLSLLLPVLCPRQARGWERSNKEQIIWKLNEGILNFYTRQRIRGTETPSIILEHGSHKENPSSDLGERYVTLSNL